jgi:hypothetical protein
MNYPLVKTGDVIVELHNNNRWYVKDWQLTEVRRYPVRQLVTVSLIERSDVIYDFEVREK